MAVASVSFLLISRALLTFFFFSLRSSSLSSVRRSFSRDKFHRRLRRSVALESQTLTTKQHQRIFPPLAHRVTNSNRIYKKIRQPLARPVHGPRTIFSTGTPPSLAQRIVLTKAVSSSSRSTSLRITRSNLPR